MKLCSCSAPAGKCWCSIPAGREGRMNAGGSIRIDDPPVVYVPCPDGSVAVLVAIHDTPDTRKAGAALVGVMQDAAAIPEPLLVVVDYRYASVVALLLSDLDAAREAAVESGAPERKEPA